MDLGNKRDADSFLRSVWTKEKDKQCVANLISGPLRSTTEVSTVRTSHQIEFRAKECLRARGRTGQLSLNTPLATNFLCNPHHIPPIQTCSAHSSQGFLPAPHPSEHSTPMPPSGIRWLVRLNLLQEQDRQHRFPSFRNHYFIHGHSLLFFSLSTLVGAEVSGKRFWENAGIKEVGGKSLSVNKVLSTAITI